MSEAVRRAEEDGLGLQAPLGILDLDQNEADADQVVAGGGGGGGGSEATAGALRRDSTGGFGDGSNGGGTPPGLPCEAPTELVSQLQSSDSLMLGGDGSNVGSNAQQKESSGDFGKGKRVSTQAVATTGLFPRVVLTACL